MCKWQKKRNMIHFISSLRSGSDLSVTHISIDQNNHSYIIQSFVYILKILADWFECSISIGSMEDFCIGAKTVYSISIEKLV